MIKRFALAILSLMFLPAWAATLKLDTLKVGSTTYSNVTILGANTTDLYFSHSLGLGNVKLKYVSSELQKRYDYNPKAAAAAEKQQIEEDLVYQSNLAHTTASGEKKSTIGSTKPALGSETGLADPILETSPLGKAAPALDLDKCKWVGDKPAMEGKFVLISFWASWSVPCKQSIPELNALQKKHSDKLVVIGVSSDAEAEIAAMTEPKVDFPTALDSKATLAKTAGISSIPCVLLRDPKGTLLYLGHPGAITDKKLEAILARASE